MIKLIISLAHHGSHRVYPKTTIPVSPLPRTLLNLPPPPDSGVEGGVVYSLCVRVSLGRVDEVNVCVS